METVRLKPSLPRSLALGLALVALFWVASWTHWGILGEYAFFPLWLGYILTVDALVAWRRGTSLLTRDWRTFVGLFVVSAPIWWIFEFHNYFLLNWHYMDTHDPSFWDMLIVGTIDFSTVVPAVFETAELFACFGFVQRLRAARHWVVTPQHLWALMYVSVGLFAGVLFLPRWFFPFTWIWLFLFVDSLNFLRGRASLIKQAASGEWRIVVALGSAGIVCGLFWEMWNSNALPKWYYTVPFVSFAKVFEMPLLGYGGYIPFAWELYVLCQLVWGLVRHPVGVLSLDGLTG